MSKTWDKPKSIPSYYHFPKKPGKCSMSTEALGIKGERGQDKCQCLASQHQGRRNLGLKMKAIVLHQWGQREINYYSAIYASFHVPHLIRLKHSWAWKVATSLNKDFKPKKVIYGISTVHSTRNTKTQIAQGGPLEKVNPSTWRLEKLAFPPKPLPNTMEAPGVSRALPGSPAESQHITTSGWSVAFSSPPWLLSSRKKKISSLLCEVVN